MISSVLEKLNQLKEFKDLKLVYTVNFPTLRAMLKVINGPLTPDLIISLNKSGFKVVEVKRQVNWKLKEETLIAVEI